MPAQAQVVASESDAHVNASRTGRFLVRAGSTVSFKAQASAGELGRCFPPHTRKPSRPLVGRFLAWARR